MLAQVRELQLQCLSVSLAARLRQRTRELLQTLVKPGILRFQQLAHLPEHIHSLFALPACHDTRHFSWERA